MDRTAHETNRLSWNEATKAHNSHRPEQARFFREGGQTLKPEELELLGDGQLHGTAVQPTGDVSKVSLPRIQ